MAAYPLCILATHPNALVFMSNSYLTAACDWQATPPVDSRPFIGGGGLEIKTAQPIIIADCVFDDNHGRQGSGLHLDACPSTLVWNSSFDSNMAQYEGGAIALVNSDGQGLLVGNSNLTRNQGTLRQCTVLLCAC